MKEGGEWEMENYNAKGKLSSTTKQSVISYTDQSNGFKAKVHSVITNEKGKELRGSLLVSGSITSTWKRGLNRGKKRKKRERK